MDTLDAEQLEVVGKVSTGECMRTYKLCGIEDQQILGRGTKLFHKTEEVTACIVSLIVGTLVSLRPQMNSDHNSQ